MKRIWILVSAVAVILALSSCEKKDAAAPVADGPHVTVHMRDGQRVPGTLTATSPSQITLKGDDNVSHTYDMKDVKSVDYDSAPAEHSAGQHSGGPSERPSAEAPRAVHEHSHAEESAIHTKTYNLAAGTDISVRTEDTIDSARAAEGQVYAAEVTKDILDAAGDVVIPRGANAQIVIKSASKGGHFLGQSDLVLDLRAVSVDGRLYQLDATDVVEKGKAGIGKNKRTAEYVGGAAAIGAIIGAIAGHGKGAAIGAGAGAAAGLGAEVLTKGHSIKIPVESVLTFRLEKPLHVAALN